MYKVQPPGALSIGLGMTSIPRLEPAINVSYGRVPLSFPSYRLPHSSLRSHCGKPERPFSLVFRFQQKSRPKLNTGIFFPLTRTQRGLRGSLNVGGDNALHPAEEDRAGSPVIKRKGRPRKKPVIDNEEVPHTGKNPELQNFSESAGKVPEMVSLVGDDGDSSDVGGQSGLETTHAEGITVVKKRRRRRKTVPALELIHGSIEQSKNLAGGGNGGPELGSPSGHEVSGDTSQLCDDEVLEKVTENPGMSSGSLDVASDSLGTGKEVNITEGEDSVGHDRVNGTVDHNLISLDSLPVQGNILVAVSEHDILDTSGDHVKPSRRARKKRKKKILEELQNVSESLGAEDVFDSILWCTVHLVVQAELKDSEQLFVVGENPELGAWDLSLALPLPRTEEAGFWENTIKVPRGTMLEYKYFTEIGGSDSSTIERRFGPEIQYFLPWKEGPGAEVEIIRDTWIPDIPTNLPFLSWGTRWWEDINSVETQDQQSEGYQDNQPNDSLSLLIPDKVPLDASEVVSDTDIEQSEVEEWLRKKIRKKVFPREEPWLLESMIMAQRSDSIRRKPQVVEVLSGVEGSEVEQEPSVQVEILINSPECTMQRMAIIEDGKLVELLLEPVNTKVQVGNVYLGVVKQLLPGMTGVFVDIGGFQLSLLDITRNQYPYTFPRIRQSTRIAAGGSMLNSFDNDENLDSEEIESGLEDDDEGEEDEHEDEDEDEEDEEEDEDEDESEDEDEDEDQDEDEDEDEVNEDKGEEELDDGEEIKGDTAKGRSPHAEVRLVGGRTEDQEVRDGNASGGKSGHSINGTSSMSAGPITVNFGRKLKKWRKIQEGMQMIVQVKKEALGKKGPRLTAFPSLAGRFWVLVPRGKSIGVSRKITGPERKRLRKLAQDLQPASFGLTVRTEALGHEREDLERDLMRLMETWKEVLERASVASEHGKDGVEPVLLHRAMGQTLTIVRDFFNDKVHRMVIDSRQCYQEVTSYLQEVAPQLSDRVELYTDKMPIFDAFNIESEIEKFSSKRVSLPNGGYLVMEETEALVSIDVNGGTGMLAQDISQGEAILAVNLAAARQIATELRLRDIGGIIVVDFIDMSDPKNEKLVLEEMKKAISRDRSSVSLSEISEFGLMEMTRKRVRPSVTFTISDPCSQCGGGGRVQAHETTLSKIERAVLRLLAGRPTQGRSSDSSKWPQFILRVDPFMGEYLKGRKRKRITQLSASLKAWLNFRVAADFGMGHFQVLEQHKGGSEKRQNGAVQTKSNHQQIGPDILGKRGWPGKRRRNFGNQVLSKEA